MKYPITSKQIWFAVYTLPRLEKTVHIRIMDLGVESFLPTRKVIKKWSDRTKEIHEPIFPNYVFVKISLQRRFELYKIPGLVKFISFEGQPAQITDKVIECIKNIVSSNCNITCESYSGKIEDKVLVKTGQFAGFEGIVSKHNGRSRLIIQIEALKQLVVVDIPAENVLVV